LGSGFVYVALDPIREPHLPNTVDLGSLEAGKLELAAVISPCLPKLGRGSEPFPEGGIFKLQQSLSLGG